MQAIDFVRTPGQPCRDPMCAEPACRHPRLQMQVASPEAQFRLRVRRSVPLAPVDPGHVAPPLEENYAPGDRIPLSKFDFSMASLSLVNKNQPVSWHCPARLRKRPATLACERTSLAAPHLTPDADG